MEKKESHNDCIKEEESSKKNISQSIDDIMFRIERQERYIIVSDFVKGDKETQARVNELYNHIPEYPSILSLFKEISKIVENSTGLAHAVVEMNENYSVDKKNIEKKEIEKELQSNIDHLIKEFHLSMTKFAVPLQYSSNEMEDLVNLYIKKYCIESTIIKYSSRILNVLKRDD